MTIIRSDTVSLRPFDTEDMVDLFDQVQRSDLASNTFPLQIPRPRSWFEEKYLLPHSDNDSRYKFAIVENADAKLIGSLDVFKIDYVHGVAELGYQIFLSENRRKGFGQAAVKLGLEWAFGCLRIERIECRILDSNTASIGLAERLGFTFEGTLRSAAFLNGARQDMKLYSMICSEI